MDLKNAGLTHTGASPGIADASLLRLRNSHTKSRNGCLQCKKRKIKCGEEKPHCATCVHRGSPCNYSSVVYAGRSAQHPPVSVFVANLGASDFAIQKPELRFCLKQMRFFHHFLVNVPHPLPLGNRKVWVNDIPQIAHQHDYLIHAMLALGATELNVDRPDISVQSDLYDHRGRAIAGLQRALNDEASWAIPGHPDAILATCYILVAQSSHMSDATDDFNIAVRGCALVTEKLHREKRATAFQLGSDDLRSKLYTALKAASPRLSLMPPLDLALESLKDVSPLIEKSAARPFGEAIYRTIAKVDSSPAGIAEAYMESMSNFSQWYYLSLGVIQCLRDPSEAPTVVILEVMLLANMIWLKVLIPLILWPRHNEKTNPFPSKALFESCNWIEAVSEWIPLELEHFLAWPQRVCEAVPGKLTKSAGFTHRSRAACIAAKRDILHNVGNQAHTMLGSVLRLASELASWFEVHATAKRGEDLHPTNMGAGGFNPIPVPLGQLNHAFSRTLRTTRGPEPNPLDESVLDSDQFPFLLFSRLG